MLWTAREKGQLTHKGKPIRLTANLLAGTLQAGREWGQYSTSLNKRIFNPEFHIQPISFISKGKIKYEQATAERFFSPSGLIRAPERSTKYRKEQSVPATAKTVGY